MNTVFRSGEAQVCRRIPAGGIVILAQPGSFERSRLPEINASGPDAPRIDKRNRDVFEVCCIASGQGGVLRYHDACDHGIAQVTGTALLVTECHEIAGMLSSGNIEGNNPVVDPVEKFMEGLD
jgi:hypothetical protein